MTMGIVLSAFNGAYFRHTMDIYLEFLPRLLFMLSLFGYLVFLILLKWGQNWSGSTPPFILNVMINMFLSPFSLAPEDKLFNGQVSFFHTIMAYLNCNSLVSNCSYF